MIFSLINKNLPSASFEALTWGLSARLEKRNAALADSGDAVISVAVVPSMDADSYKIYADGDVTCIEADRICNVFAAVGRYFVKGKFDHKGGFSAPTLPIVHKMNKPFRGLYYFSHFYNIYHVAPVEVIYDKIIDLAFYGCNCLSLTFGVQHYTSVKEPEAAAFIGRMRKMLEFADVCGLAPGLILYANSGMKDTYYGIEAQKDLDDSGRYTKALIAEFNTEICPNVPGGMEEIERQKRELLEAFVGVPIKYFTLWAYDESGCLCEKCYPWVTNGYMKIAELTRKLIKEYGFDAELMISTWHFDVKKADEWEIFYEGLKKGEYSWSPDILTSFRSGQVHKVISENGVPEGVRLIDFTEISMCGAKPWGGFGANPITLHIENLFRNCGDYYSGCFPYSEGIYEDINKWVCFGLHSGHYTRSADAVRDYIRFEFGIEDTDDLLRAIQLMETTYSRTFERTDDSGNFITTNGNEGIIDGQTYRFKIRCFVSIPEIYDIVTKSDEKIPEGLKDSWKWRLVYLRAVIDNELFNNAYITKNSEIARQAYHEINEISYTWNSKFCVYPPEGL